MYDEIIKDGCYKKEVHGRIVAIEKEVNIYSNNKMISRPNKD